MRLKHIKNAETLVYDSPTVVKDYKDYKGKWNSLFNNSNDIEIEIGMGKGNFLISKALDNPNINYIGIEKYASVILYANKKIEELNVNNLRIIVMNAFYIDEVFDKEVSKLYLNFSDPWPKTRHEKRRLTHKGFLEKYDTIFKEENIIEMKTDNDLLFDYSLNSFKEYGYQIIEINNNIDSKYKTEYEDKFFSLGKNINYVKCVKNNKEKLDK